MAYELVAAAFALTLPFGAWRVTTRRLSLWWFLAIHIPIPFIFLLRIEAGYPYTFIPFTVSACLAGQLVGGKIGTLFFRRRGHAGSRPGTAQEPVLSPARDTGGHQGELTRRVDVSS